MKISFVTLFPEQFQSVLSSSILGRAIKNGVFEAGFVNIRDHGSGKYKKVDDTPCGGGAGQVMRVDVVHKAILAAKNTYPEQKTCVILTDPAAPLFKQEDAERYSKYDHLVFVSGRYEGIDARIKHYVDESRSIGDYVLSGGELASLVMADATVRLLPGALGNEASLQSESHQNKQLEYDQYTRPVSYDGHPVPEVYLSGDHKKIALAREQEQLNKTKKIRPDLLT